MVKSYLRKSDVTKLLKKLGSNESYNGTEFDFEGARYTGVVTIGGTEKTKVYLVEYKEVK